MRDDSQRIESRQAQMSRKGVLKDFVILRPTVPLNNFRVRTDGVQENQVHSITIQSLEVPNLNFQPIPPTSKLYSIET